MKTINDIKAEQSKKVDELLKNCGVFFAFSNKQFKENKTPLEEGEKYVSIGAGGYMPVNNIDAWSLGWKEINSWFKAETKNVKTRREHIAYELSNHEAYYTGSIEDTLSALGAGYTAKEVWAVYNKESKKNRENF